MFTRPTNTYFRPRTPFVLADLQDSEATCSLIGRDNVKGLKVYPDMALNKSSGEITISDFVTEDFMEALNHGGKTLMLHVSKESVNDEVSIAEIKRFSLEYPHVNIILAHMGRCNRVADTSAFGQLAPLKNVYLETSIVTYDFVFKAGLETFGPSRILFGSDAPYCEVRGTHYELPISKRKALVTYEAYPWLWPEARNLYLEKKPPLSFLLYHEIIAIKNACTEFGATDLDKKRIFSENTNELIGCS